MLYGIGKFLNYRLGLIIYVGVKSRKKKITNEKNLGSLAVTKVEIYANELGTEKEKEKLKVFSEYKPEDPILNKYAAELAEQEYMKKIKSMSRTYLKTANITDLNATLDKIIEIIKTKPERIQSKYLPQTVSKTEPIKSAKTSGTTKRRGKKKQTKSVDNLVEKAVIDKTELPKPVKKSKTEKKQILTTTSIDFSYFVNRILSKEYKHSKIHPELLVSLSKKQLTTLAKEVYSAKLKTIEEVAHFVLNNRELFPHKLISLVPENELDQFTLSYRNLETDLSSPADMLKYGANKETIAFYKTDKYFELWIHPIRTEIKESILAHLTLGFIYKLSFELYTTKTNLKEEN
jgi:hypothetical protein